MSEDFDLGYSWGLFLGDFSNEGWHEDRARAHALSELVDIVPELPKPARTIVMRTLTRAYSDHLFRQPPSD